MYRTRLTARAASLAAALAIAFTSTPAPAANPAKKGSAGNAQSMQQHAMARQQQAMMHAQAVHPQGGNRGNTHAGRGYGYGYGNTGYNNGNHQNSGSVVSALHATMGQLARADHDYNGHRARAMHEVGQAIRHLNGNGNGGMGNGNGANRGNGNGLNRGNGNGNGNGGQRMPQAESDAHLRRAHQSLMAIQSHIANNGSTSNHMQAHSSVQRAIHELEIALNTR